MTLISSRNAELNGKPIESREDSEGGSDPSTILDSSWVKLAFMVDNNEFDNSIDKKNRYWSTASGKFTDSRVGGNIGINNAPQFTPYCDTPSEGRFAGKAILGTGDASGNYGWGHYYSEAVDDTRQVVYMRFGVPQFNSLFNFLSRAFDPNQSLVARTGRTPGVLYTAGRLMGTYLAVTTFPVIAIPILGAQVIGSFLVRSTSKFYTLKPTMHLYWSTVNTLANTLAVNIGIWPKVMNNVSSKNTDDTQKLGRPFGLDQEYMTLLSSIMPDVFDSENYFDVHSIANRAQRLANQIHSEEFDKLDRGTPTDFTGYLKRHNSGDGTHSNKVSNKKGKHRIGDLIDEVFKFGDYYKSETDTSASMETDERANIEVPKVAAEGEVAPTTTNMDDGQGNVKKVPGANLNSWKEYLNAEFRMGSAFASFTVDYTGPQSTSFSNSAADSEIANKLNSKSSEMRGARFAFAEGNILGDTVSGIIGGVADVAMGVVSGVTMNMSAFVSGLMGEGYVDVPKYWQSSTVGLARATYTMTLTATYNTPMSRMLKLYIPLSMIMAAALPRSIGKQAYTSPFLCQIFDRGRSQIRLGMIESLSIVAGAGANVGFDVRGNPLAFDVSFTVVDLSSIMHMPISSGDLLGADMTLDEDNILSDYLAVLAAQDMYSQIYPSSSSVLKAAKMAINYGKWQSPAFWAAATHNRLTTGFVVPLLTLGSGHILEAAVRGAEITTDRI